MAQLILQEGPKNLTIHISGAVTEVIDVSALEYPCEGLVLTKSRPSPETVGSVDGPTTTDIWLFADSNQYMCFDDFGGIKDGLGDWSVTLTAGVAILTFSKVHTTHPYPN